MSEQHIPMIYNALTVAAQGISAVGKNGTNTQQGWKFRSIDDIYNALNPALIAAGLTIVPNVVDKEIVMDANGKATTARLTMKYTVYAQDGSFIEATTLGEGKDFGDKACNKAMAIAYKYMAFQLFCIPTEEMRKDDPDLTVPDMMQIPTGAVKAEPAKINKTPAKNVTVTKTFDRKAEWAKAKAMLNATDEDMAKYKTALVAGGLCKDKKWSDMTDDEYTATLKGMVQNFG